MPESSFEVNDTASFKCRMSPSRQFNQSSGFCLPVQRAHYTLSAFCTEDKVPECALHINQEVSALGLPPVWTKSGESSGLNVVAVLNSMYDLIQLHRRGLRTLEDMEVEQLKSCSNMDLLQLSNTRLKDQLELSKRENTGLLERERQLQLKIKSMQCSLKNEKEEVQKLQNIIASRASQYNHDLKRKEREVNKLKERLNLLLVDKKEKKQAIEVFNYIGRADGKRSLWKTGKTEAKHEGKMYRTLLSDYDNRQKELVLENAELRKVLQQMKTDMQYILRSRKPTMKDERCGDSPFQQVDSEEDEVFETNEDSMELTCVQAREKLINSIRLQWRRLKSHVERLDSQASLAEMNERYNMIPVPGEDQELEMKRLKLEIQQCKDCIHTQQQLLQQQLSSTCHEETAYLLSDSYMLQEKKGLKEEWKRLDEHRKNLEKKRQSFTEAAIRLSHERKAFEEDQATWLKHQFLKMTPFDDQISKPKMSNSNIAFSISELQYNTPVELNKSQSHKTTSSPRFTLVNTTTTADLCQTLHRICEKSPSTNKTGTSCIENTCVSQDGEAHEQQTVTTGI